MNFVPIGSNFGYYISHPLSKDLSPKDRKVALLASILFGFTTLGLGPIFCYLFSRRGVKDITHEENRRRSQMGETFNQAVGGIEKPEESQELIPEIEVNPSDTELQKLLEQAKLHPSGVTYSLVAYRYEKLRMEKKALEWHEKAARLGNSDSYEKMKRAQEEGRITPEKLDEIKAAYEGAIQGEIQKLLQRVKVDPSVTVYCSVAFNYRKLGEENKALEWYEKAARLGNSDSYEKMKRAQEEGRITPEKLEEIKGAYEGAKSGELQKLLQNGETRPDAVADYYENQGKKEKALEWYEKAARLGDLISYDKMKRAKEEGEIPPEKLEEIKAAYEGTIRGQIQKRLQEAEANPSPAAYYLVAYGHWKLGEEGKALEWEGKAAGLGDSLSYDRIKRAKEDGKITPEKLEEIKASYEGAIRGKIQEFMQKAKLDHLELSRVAHLHEELGEEGKALEWYGKAASLGDFNSYERMRSAEYEGKITSEKMGEIKAAYEGAIRGKIQELIQGKPSSNVYDLVAYLYEKLEMEDKALEWREKAAGFEKSKKNEKS